MTAICGTKRTWRTKMQSPVLMLNVEDREELFKTLHGFKDAYKSLKDEVRILREELEALKKGSK